MQSSNASIRIWTSVPRGPNLTSRLAPSGSSSNCHYLLLVTQFHTGGFILPEDFKPRKRKEEEQARPFAAAHAERRRWLASPRTSTHASKGRNGAGAVPRPRSLSTYLAARRTDEFRASECLLP